MSLKELGTGGSKFIETLLELRHKIPRQSDISKLKAIINMLEIKKKEVEELINLETEKKMSILNALEKLLNMAQERINVLRKIEMTRNYTIINAANQTVGIIHIEPNDNFEFDKTQVEQELIKKIAEYLNIPESLTRIVRLVKKDKNNYDVYFVQAVAYTDKIERLMDLDGGKSKKSMKRKMKKSIKKKKSIRRKRNRKH